MTEEEAQDILLGKDPGAVFLARVRAALRQNVDVDLMTIWGDVSVSVPEGYVMYAITVKERP